MNRSTGAPAAETDDVAQDADLPPAATLDGLSVAGITRRRVAWLIAATVTLWIVIVFARQVGEASAASARADDMRVANAALAGDVDALERERELIQRQEFIAQQARAYGLGAGREVPFRLAPDAPALPVDAPGSTTAALGQAARVRSPLESWLSLLLGSTD